MRFVVTTARNVIPRNPRLLLAAVVVGRHATFYSYLKRVSTLLSSEASYN